MPEYTRDDVSAWCWVLVADAGHATCDGWTWEGRDGLLRCACGAVLFRAGAVAA